jgi:HEAT repeat protein
MPTVALLGAALLLWEIHAFSPGMRRMVVARTQEPGYLIDSLGDADMEVRAAAHDALVALGPEAVPHLTAALNHSECRVRLGSAVALGRMEPPPVEAVPYLLARLEVEEDELALVAVARVLGEIGRHDPAVAEAFIRLLAEGRPEVRMAVALGIREAGGVHPGFVPALVKALRDDDGRVRRDAASALGFMSALVVPSATALLDLLEADPVRLVRIRAWEALARIRGRLLTADPDLYERVGAAMARFSAEDRANPVPRRANNGNPPRVRN